MLVIDVVTVTNGYWSRLGKHEAESLQLRSAGFINSEPTLDMQIKGYLASRFAEANRERNPTDPARFPSGISCSTAETFLFTVLNQGV